ncbi:MAG TPA: hypothetical protein V6C97_01225 [Oculatellaceae cyanobacterium]
MSSSLRGEPLSPEHASISQRKKDSLSAGDAALCVCVCVCVCVVCVCVCVCACVCVCVCACV